MSDKLDRMNRDKAMRSNLIKWWNVNMQEAGEEKNNRSEDTAEIDLLPLSVEDEELVNKIVKSNDKTYVYDKTMVEVKEKEANEIYERLMREAMEDEAKKQEEIEKVKQNYNV